METAAMQANERAGAERWTKRQKLFYQEDTRDREDKRQRVRTGYCAIRLEALEKETGTALADSPTSQRRL